MYVQAQGGFSRFQEMGMIEWGQKSKPKKDKQKSVRLPTQPQKIPFPCHISALKFDCTLLEELCSHQSHIVLNKKFPTFALESNHPKKYFPTPKNPGIESFNPPKNLQSSIPIILLEIWSTPLGIQVIFYQIWELIIFGEECYQGVLILIHLPAVQNAKKNWRVSKKKNITRREKEAPTGKNTAWAVLIVWNPGNGNKNIPALFIITIYWLIRKIQSMV